jgi:carboxyl-terminal processing protease
MQLLGILLGAFKWFTVFEIILCVINLVMLVWYAIPVRKYYRWLDFVPSVGLLVAIAGVLYGDTSLPALAIYTLTTIIFLCTVKKTFRPVRQILVPKYRWMRIVMCLCGVIPIALALLTAGALRYNPVLQNKTESGWATKL